MLPLRGEIKITIVTTVHKQRVIYGLFNSSNYTMTLGVRQVYSSIVSCNLFQIRYFLIARFLYWQARNAVPLP